MKNSTRLSLAWQAARVKKPSPLGALCKGLLAGVVGAWAQDQFFRATKKWTPAPSAVPPSEGRPEFAARHETPLETVARRLIEDLMKRGPLDEAGKKRVARAVHYAFGAGWGGLYALSRETAPRLPASVFGAAVWMLSDNLLLPAFRVALWPSQYRAAEHHYALQAHLAYGLATAGAYAVLRDLGVSPLAALPALIALRAKLWLKKTPPGRLVEKQRAAPTRWFWQAADRAFAH